MLPELVVEYPVKVVGHELFIPDNARIKVTWKQDKEEVALGSFLETDEYSIGERAGLLLKEAKYIDEQDGAQFAVGTHPVGHPLEHKYMLGVVTYVAGMGWFNGEWNIDLEDAVAFMTDGSLRDL